MSVNVDSQPINVADELRRDKANTILAAARLSHRRGHLDEAFRQCREALLMLEQNAQAHELMGDILRDQNKDDAALQEYRRALELDPKLAGAEEKIGILSIERDSLMRFEQRRQELIADATKRKFEERNPVIAGSLSVILPGAGQWYNDDVPRAIAVFCTFAVTLFLFLYCITGLFNELKVLHPELVRKGQLPTIDMLTQQLGQKGAPYSIWILLNGLAFAGAWLYGIVEAPLTAARSNQFLRKHLGIE